MRGGCLSSELASGRYRVRRSGNCDSLYQEMILNEEGMRSLYQGRVDQQRSQQAKIKTVCAMVSGSRIW